MDLLAERELHGFPCWNPFEESVIFLRFEVQKSKGKISEDEQSGELSEGRSLAMSSQRRRNRVREISRDVLTQIVQHLSSPFCPGPPIHPHDRKGEIPANATPTAGCQDDRRPIYDEGPDQPLL
ncbi:unnamed protein product [Nesidiocoris tenuis]|uniref:Uncharacterized protein n=1 Tax=Nesidiocoris tenuis TaxID=355587 RepID=A0A6H5H2U7_9HEMI|nr:unnamed protein product [Nesidiocoris tenuis]